MFTAALFTVARTWKQPKCPSIEEWIRKLWYIDTMEYFSAIEKNGIMPLSATWTDLEAAMLREVKTNTVCYYCLYVGFKEMLQVYKFTAHVEDKLVVTRRKVMGVTNWEIGIGIYALLYTE